MCDCKSCCQKPEELKNVKGDSAKCAPEQIEKCHGDAKDHPCEKKDSQ